MTTSGRTVLDEIVERKRQVVEAEKTRCSLADLKKRLADAPPVISFSKAIKQAFGLIAEIKRKSPSQGPMRHQNVAEIASLYQASEVVRAISVLTDCDYFDMNIEALAQVRALTKKPILRKDFILDEYQVYEARANGADAVLLMANVLTDQAQLNGLFDLSVGLGMDVLYECRSPEDISRAPKGTTIYGINTRKMQSAKVLGFNFRYAVSRLFGRFSTVDKSIELDTLNLVGEIPSHALKVAESGLSAHKIAEVRHVYQYNAALVGTAMLNSPHGVQWSLNEFERAIKASKRLVVPASVRHASRHHPVPV